MADRPAYGAVRHIPDEVTCAWGARFIWPNDLVWDRQDIVGSDPARKRLTVWLNGGALNVALKEAYRLADSHELAQDEQRMVTLYEDEHGVIVGDPQGSFGYLYVAGWLKG